MASNPQHEPTMEEILASIRKIISEDSTEAPAAAAPAAAGTRRRACRAAGSRRSRIDSGTPLRAAAGTQAGARARCADSAARAQACPGRRSNLRRRSKSRRPRRRLQSPVTTSSPTRPARRWTRPSPRFPPPSNHRRRRPNHAGPATRASTILRRQLSRSSVRARRQCPQCRRSGPSSVDGCEQGRPSDRREAAHPRMDGRAFPRAARGRGTDRGRTRRKSARRQISD